MATRILQKIKKTYSTPMEVGIRYYALLSLLNNLKLTDREVQLLAFTATRGDISSGGSKQQFMEQVKTTKATIGNLISSLYDKKLLIKEDNDRIKVIPAIRLDFSKPLLLEVMIDTDDTSGN